VRPVIDDRRSDAVIGWNGAMPPLFRRPGGAGALVAALAIVACSDGGRGSESGDGEASSPETSTPETSTPETGAPTAAGSRPAGSTVEETTAIAGNGSEASSVTVGSAPSERPPCDVPGATAAELADATIADAVDAVPSLSTLAGALDAAGLTPDLAGHGPVTLFAPTDAAFDALDPAERDALLSDPAGALASVLSLHVVADAAATSDDLAAAGGVPTAAGAPLAVTAGDGAVVVDSGGQVATVTCPDIEVANGVLHLIDAVLLPPPVDTQAVAGSLLYTVDVESGAVTLVGSFGSELGVLGITATADGDLVAVTDRPQLISFPPTDPAALTSRMPVSGADGTTLLAIDVRPGIGELLAFSDAGVLYSIERASGTATPVGDGLDPPLDDPGFGFDVDAGGTVRVVVATGTSVRIDASTGAVTATDPAPAYAAGDVNDGVAPRVVALASAPAGDPLVVDAATASLARLGADGSLTTIGPLYVSLTDGASLDVGADGTVYLAVPG